MTRIVRPVVFVLLAAAVGACGTGARDEIVGNNTGGVIPPSLARNADVQSLANAHCAKWGGTANITFNLVEAGGEVVFVCIMPAAPAAAAAPTAESQAGAAATSKAGMTR